MPRTIEGIKKQVPKKTNYVDYKTRTLVKVWFRLLYKILRQSSRQLKRHFLLVVFILIIILVFSVALVSSGSSNNPIPSKYRNGLKFQLFYPSNLPVGYNVDKASFQRQGDVLIFYISSPTGKKIGVSEEPLPASLPSQASSSKAPIPLPGVKDFTTSIGQAHIGLSSDKYLSDIITPNTWIILNVSGYTLNQAQAVTQSFTLVKN